MPTRSGQGLRPASGREGQEAQSRRGAVEPVLSGPALGEMQGRAVRLAGDAPGQGDGASHEGLDGGHRFKQAGALRKPKLPRREGGLYTSLAEPRHIAYRHGWTRETVSTRERFGADNQPCHFGAVQSRLSYASDRTGACAARQHGSVPSQVLEANWRIVSVPPTANQSWQRFP